MWRLSNDKTAGPHTWKNLQTLAMLSGPVMPLSLIFSSFFSTVLELVLH